jgi:hypothetical protein
MTTLFLALGLFAPQDLTDDSFEKLRTYITPKPQEMVWREIPWRPVFWDAVIEGQQKDRPILLWGMNGHPLACT